jgi:integrase
MIINGVNYKNITYREDRNVYQVKVKGKTKTCKTLDDAIRARTQLKTLDKLNENLLSDIKQVNRINNKPVIPTLEAGYWDWFNRYKKQTVEYNTYSCYKTAAKMFFPYLGKMQVNKISIDILQDVSLALQEKALDVRGSYLSRDYVKANLNKLSIYFDYLVSKQILELNPLRVGKIHLHKTIKQKRRAMTIREINRFLHTAKHYNYEWFLFFYTCIQTGCRRGEVAGLRYENINYKRKYIEIKHSVKESEHGQQLGTTKTKNTRTIPISDKLAYCLRMRNHEKGYVFCCCENQPYNLQNISAKFKYICRLAGLDDELTLHDTRHTFASRMVNAGIDIPTVKAIGGWESSQVLLDIYSHSNDARKMEAMQKVIF